MSEEFKYGDIVRITGTGHFYTGQFGKVTHVGQPGGARLELRLRDNTICYASDSHVTKQSLPEVGDLVRVLASGRWQAQEGHVEAIDKNGFVVVDLEHDYDRPVFDPLKIEIIERLPAKPFRVSGQPIDAKDVKIGDKISVTTHDNQSSDVKRVTTLIATVGKIVPRGFNGQTLTFQTTGGSEFFSESISKREIILLESIEEDAIYKALSALGPGSVIVFANKPGEAETDMAIKQYFEDLWHLVDGSKDRKPRTVGLVNIIKKKGVPFSVIRQFEKKED